MCPQPPTQRKLNQWVEILITFVYSKMYVGTLETIFHGQTTFRLAWGSLNWSETPYFHKGAS